MKYFLEKKVQTCLWQFRFLLFLPTVMSSQPNCEAYKYYGKEKTYLACLKGKETKGKYQFSKEYQIILNEALKIDSSYAFAYQAKGYAYLKSGDITNWEFLMGKAVNLEPDNYLGYRGWCRYQFFRNYKGAIEDIERLKKIAKGDIGFSQNGDYHLEIALGLCYKGLGQYKKAVKIIREQLENPNHFIGIYDYLHLGVLYMELKLYDRALQCFEKQEKENSISENEFYRAICYRYKGDVEKSLEHLEISKNLYLNGRHMFDPYTHHPDRIFLSDIESEIVLSKTLNK